MRFLPKKLNEVLAQETPWGSCPRNSLRFLPKISRFLPKKLNEVPTQDLTEILAQET